MIPSLREAATDAALRGRDRQLLLVLAFELDPITPRAVKHGALADRLRMKRTHVSRSLRHLVRMGYLEQGEDDGALCTYRICWQRSAGPRVVPSRAPNALL